MSLPTVAPPLPAREGTRRRRWPPWLVAALAAAPLALLFALQHDISLRSRGHLVPFGQLLGTQLVRWYLWAALVPGVVAVARRLRLDATLAARDVAWRMAGQGVAAAAFAAVHATLSSLFDQWFLGNTVSGGYTLGQRVLAMFLADLLVYAGVVAVYYAAEYAVRSREHELQASQLRARLAEARLALLHQRLQPHFLFNTLNAVASLMHEDVDAADEMLAALSDLLRAALREDDAREVPLREELRFTERYLDIMKMRLGARLRVAIAVRGDALEALVPALLLQPLVENAVRHGIADRAAGGALWVHAERRESMLRVAVGDDGPGLPPEWDTLGGAHRGLGLRATHARLAQMYGAAHELTLRNHPAGGLEVTVVVPYRTAPDAARAGSAAP